MSNVPVLQQCPIYSSRGEFIIQAVRLCMAAPVHVMLMHMGTASSQALARSCCFQIKRLYVVQGVYPANINWLHGHYSEGNSAISPKHNREHPPLAAAYASEAANATEEVSPFRRASQAEQGAAAAEVPPVQHIQAHMPQEQTSHASERVAAEAQAPESLPDGTAGEVAAGPAVDGRQA